MTHEPNAPAAPAQGGSLGKTIAIAVVVVLALLGGVYLFAGRDYAPFDYPDARR